MKHLARLLREPLLHFFVFGGLIFLLFVAVSGPPPEPMDTIVVGPERIEQLRTGFQGTWRRPPTDDELRAIINDFVREEIYYREALALGLDRDDTVVRRRMRQKMEFLSDTGADLLEPVAGELEAYFAENQHTYQLGPRLSFEQVFLGETPEPERIESSLEAFRVDPATDPSPWSEHTLLPVQLTLSTPEAINGVFGKGFYDRLEALPAGVWSGPVESSYGMHLVRVTESLPARVQPMQSVRDAVLRDWKTTRALELRELHYARLLEHYSVKIHDSQRQAEESR